MLSSPPWWHRLSNWRAHADTFGYSNVLIRIEKKKHWEVWAMKFVKGCFLYFDKSTWLRRSNLSIFFFEFSFFFPFHHSFFINMLVFHEFIFIIIIYSFIYVCWTKQHLILIKNIFCNENQVNSIVLLFTSFSSLQLWADESIKKLIFDQV